MNERERIGKRIAELRNEKGISQAALASLSGLGQGHIARIELGQYNVGVDTLSKISNALGVKLELVRESIDKCGNWKTPEKVKDVVKDMDLLTYTSEEMDEWAKRLGKKAGKGAKK